MAAISKHGQHLRHLFVDVFNDWYYDDDIDMHLQSKYTLKELSTLLNDCPSIERLGMNFFDLRETATDYAVDFIDYMDPIRLLTNDYNTNVLVSLHIVIIKWY